MKISLLIVATNKYVQFLPKLLQSVADHFLTNADKCIHIYTDQIHAANALSNNSLPFEIKIHAIEHKPWPHATLKRFHFFKQYVDQIEGHYVFYIDADTIIKAEITEEILSPRTVVQHCGYVNGGGTFEERQESRAYTPKALQKNYYGGGFWGFDRTNFRFVVDKAVEMIDEDESNGIIPIWHDESVLNALMAHMEPTKVLTPSYHWPQGCPKIINKWKEHYPCKILLLKKDHKEFQV